MAVFFLPKIGPENYPIFLTIEANDFPKTFKEWERMMLQKKRICCFDGPTAASPMLRSIRANSSNTVG